MTQPFASLVACRAKAIETRSWSTAYRGWLAIHAAKTMPLDAQRLCFREPFLKPLREVGLVQAPHAGARASDLEERLPRGAVVAVAHLHAVGRIGRNRDGAVIVETQELPVTDAELAFGDYTPGRYGWRFSNVAPLPQPLPARGSLGLWEWQPPAELADWLRHVVGPERAAAESYAADAPPSCPVCRRVIVQVGTRRWCQCGPLPLKRGER